MRKRRPSKKQLAKAQKRRDDSESGFYNELKREQLLTGAMLHEQEIDPEIRIDPNL